MSINFSYYDRLLTITSQIGTHFISNDERWPWFSKVWNFESIILALRSKDRSLLIKPSHFQYNLKCQERKREISPGYKSKIEGERGWRRCINTEKINWPKLGQKWEKVSFELIKSRTFSSVLRKIILIVKISDELEQLQRVLQKNKPSFPFLFPGSILMRLGSFLLNLFLLYFSKIEGFKCDLSYGTFIKLIWKQKIERRQEKRRSIPELV